VRTDYLCGFHRGLHQNFFSLELTGIGYTGESGLTGVAYTSESGLNGVGNTGKNRLPSVAYTGESLVQPSRPTNAHERTIPEKVDCEC
jgi:hypothetical protein